LPSQSAIWSAAGANCNDAVVSFFASIGGESATASGAHTDDVGTTVPKEGALIVAIAIAANGLLATGVRAASKEKIIGFRAVAGAIDRLFALSTAGGQEWEEEEGEEGVFDDHALRSRTLEPMACPAMYLKK